MFGKFTSTAKLTFQLHFWIMFIVTLVACEPATLMPTITPTVAPHPTLSLQPSIILSPTSMATPLVNKQLWDAWSTQNALATPIRTPIAGANYNKSSNVYTSDDGKKIVFYRGETEDNVYSANADGSNEQLIIKSKSLPILGQGRIKALTFVSKTHFLLFNTYLCNPHKFLYDASDCAVGIYSVDTDTGKINELLAGLNGNTMQERNFEVSPDGRYMSVATSGHIDIYYLSLNGPADSDIAYQNAILYWRTKPDEYLPKQYWLPDSSGLIAIIAISPYNEPSTLPSTYAAYRYKLGDKASKIPLDKFIMQDTQGDFWCVSPDRNWILFSGNDTGDPRRDTLDYLGNLTTGHTQAYELSGWPLYSCQWSPDSKHFVSNTNTIGFIGSVNGSPPIPIGGYFMKWIDATHYYYSTMEKTVDTIRIYIGEISGN